MNLLEKQAYCFATNKWANESTDEQYEDRNAERKYYWKAGIEFAAKRSADIADGMNLVIDEGEDAGTILMFGGAIGDEIRKEFNLSD